MGCGGSTAATAATAATPLPSPAPKLPSKYSEQRPRSAQLSPKPIPSSQHDPTRLHNPSPPQAPLQPMAPHQPQPQLTDVIAPNKLTSDHLRTVPVPERPPQVDQQQPKPSEKPQIDHITTSPHSATPPRIVTPTQISVSPHVTTPSSPAEPVPPPLSVPSLAAEPVSAAASPQTAAPVEATIPVTVATSVDTTPAPQAVMSQTAPQVVLSKHNASPQHASTEPHVATPPPPPRITTPRCTTPSPMTIPLSDTQVQSQEPQTQSSSAFPKPTIPSPQVPQQIAVNNNPATPPQQPTIPLDSESINFASEDEDMPALQEKDFEEAVRPAESVTTVDLTGSSPISHIQEIHFIAIEDAVLNSEAQDTSDGLGSELQIRNTTLTRNRSRRQSVQMEKLNFMHRQASKAVAELETLLSDDMFNTHFQASLAETLRIPDLDLDDISEDGSEDESPDQSPLSLQPSVSGIESESTLMTSSSISHDQAEPLVETNDDEDEEFDDFSAQQLIEIENLLIQASALVQSKAGPSRQQSFPKLVSTGDVAPAHMETNDSSPLPDNSTSSSNSRVKQAMCVAFTLVGYNADDYTENGTLKKESEFRAALHKLSIQERQRVLDGFMSKLAQNLAKSKVEFRLPDGDVPETVPGSRAHSDDTNQNSKISVKDKIAQRKKAAKQRRISPST